MTSNTPIVVKSAVVQNETIQIVDAKELWSFLEVNTKFTEWIKLRIEEYGFEEGKEFFLNFGKTSPLGGRPSKEYTITLDMAKELAMVERNAKGKQARRYFIECERKLKEARQQKAIEAEKRLKQLESKSNEPSDVENVLKELWKRYPDTDNLPFKFERIGGNLYNVLTKAAIDRVIEHLKEEVVSLDKYEKGFKAAINVLLEIMGRLERDNVNATFLLRLAKYRSMGLTLEETAILLKSSESTVTGYEAILKEKNINMDGLGYPRGNA
ncbi:MAG: antA/AntB antirepressor family protein [Nitrospirae bacterium]|nr:antA/AntB antirepressor family protein [Nitrospirota bacterium]